MISTTGKVAHLGALAAIPEGAPHGVEVAGVDLVLIRVGDDVSALHGRCAHRGARLADGHIEGDALVCDLHGWRYDTITGIAPVNPSRLLH